MIVITDVRKVYGRGDKAVVALDNVNLEVPRGVIFGVAGQSGAGKSTLIRCVNLLEAPTAGKVVVNGQELTALSAPALRRARQRIGMIFQHFNLLDSRTVAENVAFPLEVIGYKPSARRARVRELLSLVGLEEKAGAYPRQLSGGQKQRVGIARALAAEPDVLLSDEATSALDPQTTQSILELLRDLNQRLGLTILLITHQMEVIRDICHQVALLEAGRVIESGKVAELAARPDSHLARAFFPKLPAPPPQPGKTVATLTFSGAAADEPLLSTLVRQFGLEVTILRAAIETFDSQRIGQVQVELAGERVSPALDYLRTLGLTVEAG